MYIDKDILLEKTNGGLDIILKYFPDAERALNNRDRKFKLREDEKTASASLKKLTDGNYVVTDFGGDQVSRNAISLFAHHNNKPFGEALQYLAAEFGVDAKAQAELYRPEIIERAAKEDEKEGELIYKAKNFTTEELKAIGPFVDEDLCAKYHMMSLEWYGRVKDGRIKEMHSTEHYPIFIFEYKTWRKLYQPKSLDKAYRFQYGGTREKEVVVGLDVLSKAYDTLNEDYDVESEEETKKKMKKIPEVIICSGERDALNIASLGYQVVWFNSETEKISNKQFNSLRAKAEKVMNLPDLDKTGLQKAHERALLHLDLHTIELPADLATRFDWRENPCKDATDYVNIYKNKSHFKKLVDSAMPYRMWDEKYTNDGMKYFFNHAHTYNFLQKNGFYRLRIPNEKRGYAYVKIEGNVVREVTDVEVKSFINDFIKNLNMKTDLRNLFFRSQMALSEKSLSNLDQVELDFTDYTKESQFLFFKNATWEVTKDAVKEHTLGTVGRFVWQDEVIDHKVKVQDPPFIITRNEAGNYSIEIKDKSCLFFKYLINTSRIYWRKEDEEKTPLSKIELQEQDLHLINKIYGLGYLLHRYKDPNRPWCIYAMDNKISENDESHGGSGKSIAMKSVRYFMKYVTLEGRNAKLTENQHLYENVTEHTDYVLIDDANRYLNFDFFFSALTGEMTVNPKHGKQYVIPFEDVPKLAITSNFTLRHLDPSTERRLLYMVFSDYYHFNKDNEYKESRSPYDEFGKNLFQDFTEKEWNNFFNVMAHCLKTYLSFPKIDPPMENVVQRNLLTEMGPIFKDWADVYFNEDRLDMKVSKKEAVEDFKINGTKHQSWTPNRWKKALHAWCNYYDYTMNPKELCNSGGRIIERNGTETEEMIFIQTKPYESTSATVKPGEYESAAGFDPDKF